MVLRPYQQNAVRFLRANPRSMVLAPVGAGKTAIVLTAMQDALRDGSVKRFLVVAPKRVAQYVWPVEAPLWAPGLDVAVAVGAPTRRAAAFNSAAQVVVTNYDNLQTIPHVNFDGVVFDELTRLKNPAGARFKALFNSVKSPVRWGLTGSFTSNGLIDVFGQCKIVDQQLLGRSRGAFLQQYFDLVNPQFGEWEPRKGSLENVMARIKPATFVLDPGVYTNTLPEVHTVFLSCDMPMGEYNEMKNNFILRFPTTDAIAANAGVVTGKLQQLTSGFVYASESTPSSVPGTYDVTRTVHRTNRAKFDLLDSLLEENQRANTIVVYQFREELAELRRSYPHSVTLDDPDAIDRWNRGEIELLLVHPKSAGHGLNLQHGGNKIVFLSLPWSWELYEQTLGRIHRSGQQQDVWCYILSVNGTVDERIWAALRDKASVSTIALGELR